MNTAAKPRSDKFRFSLQFLFVIVTLACIWLGWRSYRTAWANAVLKRENQIIEAINANIRKAPKQTELVNETGPLMVLPQRTVRSLLSYGAGDSQGLVVVDLKISRNVLWHDRQPFIQTIADYYIKDLENLGLTMHQGGIFFISENTSALTGAVYKTRVHSQLNFLVTINVTADFTDQTARVVLSLYAIE